MKLLQMGNKSLSRILGFVSKVSFSPYNFSALSFVEYLQNIEFTCQCRDQFCTSHRACYQLFPEKFKATRSQSQKRGNFYFVIRLRKIKNLCISQFENLFKLLKCRCFHQIQSCTIKTSKHL